MKKKTGMRVSVIVLVFLSLSMVFAVSAVEATAVKVAPAYQEVTQGSDFSVNVVVEDVVNMKADQAVLIFNPNAMQVTGITEGDFLKTGGNTIGVPGWNNTAGRAWFGYTLTGTWTPVSGDGILAIISFTADTSAEGIYDLELTKVVLVDGDNNEITVGTIDGTVTIQRPNQPPTLSSGSVTPSSGDASTTFNYYVTYTDSDDDAPTTRYVYIDGSPHTMTKISGSYTSGATFKYSTTLSAGSHNYYFFFNDGHGHTKRLPTSGTYPGPSVSLPNKPPILSSGSVTPPSGDVSTTFSYYVTYTDPDGDAPTTKYVYIDGSSHTMTKISGSYTSGATFKYSTTLSGGSHNYYFYFNDGHGHGVRLPTSGTKSGPSVSLNQPPIAYIDSITPDPAEQGKDTVSFIGHGTDSDGSVVAYNWRSSINGLLSTSASFTKLASDLSEGTHTIYFKVQDNEGAWSTEVTEDLTVIVPQPVHNINTGENFGTIQAAIDDSDTQNGHTITVDPGTYTENVNVNKQLTVRSTSGNPVDTIVQASNSNDHIFEVTADYANIFGFTVKGATKSGKAGIYLGNGPSHCTISNNIATNNDYGIHLVSSSNNKLSANVIHDNKYNFGVSGNDLQYFVHDIDTSNTVNGKPIYYWVSENDREVPANAGYVAVVNSSDITVKDLSLTNNGQGVLFAYTYDSNVENINTLSNYIGIYLHYSINNNVISNTVNSNDYHGISLSYSTNNNITNNIANSNKYDGIALDASSNNILTYNSVSGNERGINLYSSNNNVLTNNIANSNKYGIRLYSSNSNTVSSNSLNSNGNDGIYVKSSNDNTLTNNIINSNGDDGIQLSSSAGNNLTNNIVSNNADDGIYLYKSSSSNIIFSNNITSNNKYGIRLRSSSSNTIYNNYFDNKHNARDDGHNIWNITKTAGTNIIGGPWLGGNYWSDYAGTDTNGDGLGDTLLPYNSFGDIKKGGDYLPLVVVSNQPPIAYIDSITPDPAEQGTDTVSFSGHGTDSDGSVVAYRWRSSIDGLLSTSASFTKPASELSVGTHTIYFKVQDDDGAWSAEVSEDLTINPANHPPTAIIDLITPDPAEQGTDTVSFSGHGTDSDGSVVAYNWRSSIDGLLSTSASFTKPASELSVGTHTIYFKVQDDDGAWSAEVSEDLTITPANQPPTAIIDLITPDPAEQGTDTVSFSGNGTDSDGSVVAYNWRSDKDGFLSDKKDFDKPASELSVGTHTIYLKVQDDDGAWSSAEVSEDLTITPANQPPTAIIDLITPDPAEQGTDTVSFSGNGTDSDGSVVAYNWRSDKDGFLSDKKDFDKPASELSVGTHTIYLKVQDDDGAWSTEVTEDLTVIVPQPVHNINTSEGFATIQAAIDDLDTQDGHTIIVDAGTYNENVVVNKRLTIYSRDGAEVTIVQAADSNMHVFNVTANQVNITGFTMKGATGWYKTGIYLYYADHCNVSYNIASSNGNGIYLYHSNNSMLTNNTANNNDHYGIYLSYCDHNTLTGNTANNNHYYGIGLSMCDNNILSHNIVNSNRRYSGIKVYCSNNNTLSHNQMNNNKGINLAVGGYAVEDYDHTIDTTNTVNGKPVYYYFGQSNLVLDNLDTKHITVVNARNVTIKNNDVSNGDPIELAFTTDSTVQNNIANYNEYGIWLNCYCNNNNIINNTINNNDHTGIRLNIYCQKNNIIDNTANNNDYAGISLTSHGNNYNKFINNTLNNNGWYGITSSYSHYNEITGNIMNDNNRYGIELWYSSSNNITCNWVAYNQQRGFYLRGSIGNTIENNNIMSNGVSANDSWHYNFYNDQSDDVTAEYNYWGTDNSTLIAESIYDKSDNPSKGTIDFEPFLTEPAPCAPGPEAEPPSITSFAPSSPVNDTACSWRTFNITVNQTVNVSWYLNDSFLFTNESVTEADCTLHAEVASEHNVSAVASNENGTDMQTWVWNVTVANQPPIANFTYSPEYPIVNQTITFNASSSYDPDPGGYIVEYEWDFGDGTYGTGMITTHLYSSAGIYTVNLTVTDDKGAKNFTSKTIEVREARPTVSVSTDKYEYHPGDKMNITIHLENPTENAQQVIFAWYLFLPDYNHWQEIMLTEITLPSGYDEYFSIPMGIENWPSEEFDAIWYVALYNTTPPYELISWDYAEWKYVPHGMAKGERVVEAEEIAKTIKRSFSFRRIFNEYENVCK